MNRQKVQTAINTIIENYRKENGKLARNQYPASKKHLAKAEALGILDMIPNAPYSQHIGNTEIQLILQSTEETATAPTTYQGDDSTYIRSELYIALHEDEETAEKYSEYEDEEMKHKDTGSKFNLAQALRQLDEFGADTPLDWDFDPTDCNWFYNNPDGESDEGLIGAYWKANSWTRRIDEAAPIALPLSGDIVRILPHTRYAYLSQGAIVDPAPAHEHPGGQITRVDFVEVIEWENEREYIIHTPQGMFAPDEIEVLHEATAAEIAQRYGIASATVSQTIERLNWQAQGHARKAGKVWLVKWRRAESHWAGILTWIITAASVVIAGLA